MEDHYLNNNLSTSAPFQLLAGWKRHMHLGATTVYFLISY